MLDLDLPSHDKPSSGRAAAGSRTVATQNLGGTYTLTSLLRAPNV